MSDSEPRGFLGRWSRRKAEARQAARQPQPAAPDTPQDEAPAHPVAPQPTTSDTGVALQTPDASADDGQPGRAAPMAHGPAQAVSQPALPTLDDVRALTADSDFSKFVGRGVTPEVRNAAMKKLFADPHFNVMDGLDIYIDDYTGRETLPASTMRAMAGSKFLKLFDEKAGAADGAARAAADAVDAGPQAVSLPDVDGESTPDEPTRASSLEPEPPEGQADASMIESTNAGGERKDASPAFPVSDKAR